MKDREVPPLFHSDDGDMVSFLQMIEIMVAARFRKSRSVSFRRVRDAYLNARESWGIEYPFAHMKLTPLGGHIIHFLNERRATASYQALDTPEQWTLPRLLSRETTDQLVYDHELAVRWFPVGKTVPIVIDPRLSTGSPIILGRGVTIQAIRKRFFTAGLSIEFIAKDYQLRPDLVETAIQYGGQVFGERVAA